MSNLCPVTGEICTFLESLDDVSAGITERDCSSRRGIDFLRRETADELDQGECYGAVQESGQEYCGNSRLDWAEKFVHDQASFIGIKPQVLKEDFSYKINK